MSVSIILLKCIFYPRAAELFVSIFHSFEAAIAKAISSFKRMKNSIIDEK